ncbi:MAG TPA: O-antigen ligase family protein, partial [Candidatus Aquilonibacter sp.]|nr:O-antigen ligase family protein [Candidatus Aquilonibacter sp.]
MRDAVVWGYGLFALFIIIFTLEDYRAPKVIQGMMPWMRCFLIVIPVPLLLFYVFNITLPIPFFPSVSLFDVRRGDTAVYLAAIVAFVLTGLGSQPRKHPHPLTPLTNVLCAIGFIVSALIVISASRGAFMALLLSLATVAILRPSARLILAGAIALVLAIVVACANPTIKLSTGRQISSSQVVENVTSTFSHTSGDVEMEEARQWRIDWWHSIIHYTIDGPYFWLGKGFGVDLASDDGFAVSKDDQTRSPHDACLNILARTGVVGLCLWILLQGAFVILVFRGYLAARRYGAEWWISVNVWLLATWVAFTVNM